MVHKKYTYKDGKKFGPYYYETKRVDGKIITTYLGNAVPKNRKNILYSTFILIGFIAAVLALYFVSFSFTGNVSLDMKTNYKFGEQISGNLNLNLLEGELLPADSVVSVKYGNFSQDFKLSDLISDEKVSGSFYADGVSLSGNGDGYGVPGKIKEYPLIKFQLEISESDKSNTGGSEPAPESVPESTPEPVPEPETSPESTPETPSEEPSESVGITGAATSGFEIIDGTVDAENPFTYSLSEGETADLVKDSVYSNNSQIPDNSIQVDSSESEVTVTTDYFIEKEGFGEEYVGNSVKKISVDLESLGLIVDSESVLSISINYEGQKIVETSEEITISNNEDQSIEIPVEEPTLGNETIPGNITEFLNETEFNETIVNVTEPNRTIINGSSVNVSTVQFAARIGEPVKWVKKVSIDELNESLSLIVEIPASADNVTIDKISSSNTEIIEEPIQPPIENVSDSKPDLTIGITGEVTSDIDLKKETIFSKILSFFRFTGRVVDSEDTDVQEIYVELEETDTTVEIEYYTDAPSASEEVVNDRLKKVYVSSPDDVHYKNVVVFTNLSDGLRLRDYSSIKIEWVENGTLLEVYYSNDTNSDGYYDYIEWVAPHLSNQTFNIIVIVNAEHLDSSREFISNIYNETKALDGVWSETIPSGDYVRVRFERNLTSENDISIYPRIISGSPTIEVYEINGGDLIMQFDNLVEDRYNKRYLTNLLGSQDTFDLLVSGGSVEFDHIIDPTTTVSLVANAVAHPATNGTHTDTGGFSIQARSLMTAAQITNMNTSNARTYLPGNPATTLDTFVYVNFTVPANDYIWQIIATTQINSTSAAAAVTKGMALFNFSANGWQRVNSSKGGVGVLNVTTYNVTPSQTSNFVAANTFLVMAYLNSTTNSDNIGIDIIQANITYEPAQNPWVNLTAPVNGTTIGSDTISFNATFTDNFALRNATLFIWNSSFAVINQTDRTITGTSDGVNISVTLPYTGTFYWNYFAVDNSSNAAMNSSNFTLVVSISDTTPPQVTINQPQNASVPSPILFNVTTNENSNYANYTLNNGLFNYTMQNNGNRDFNATNASIANGQYTARFFVWDTAGNLNSTTNVTFIVVTPINVWISSVNTNWTNATAWSLGRVPIAGDNVVFNASGIGNATVNNNSVAQNLASFLVESGYTGKINFTSLFAVGSWTGANTGTQLWNVTGNINISGGTVFVNGDYPYNITFDGHGQEWRSTSGNITIGSGAVIDGVGLGFPSDIGPGFLSTSGGTHGGRGDNPNDAFVDPYGNATAPTSLGSGGGALNDLGHGGSGIKLQAVKIITVDGIINVSATNQANDHTGAGGSIWLKADIINVSGIIKADGGIASTLTGNALGGGGRIRLEYGSALGFNASTRISVRGGDGSDVSGLRGKSGTLTFTNNTWPGNWNLTGDIGLLGGDYGEGITLNVLGSFNTNGYNLTIYGDCFGNSGSYKSSVCYNATSDGRGVWINASGNITVTSTSFVGGIGLGFPTGAGPGFQASKGGTHGGKGNGNTLATYGNETMPLSLGSGGGFSYPRGFGGSALKLQTEDGILIINGVINMTGDVGANVYSGAGGSIWLVSRNITGSGMLDASGGVSTAAGDSAAGGGRIALTSIVATEFRGVVKNIGGPNPTTPGSGGTVFINSSNSIKSMMNITTAGHSGGNITFRDTLVILSGIYNATGINLQNGTIIVNYTDCASSIVSATFIPNVTVQSPASCTGDTTPPNLTINQPQNASLLFPILFNITTEENVSFVNYTLDNGVINYTMQNNGNRDFNATNATIVSGQYTVRYFAWDTAGNLNSTANRTFIVEGPSVGSCGMLTFAGTTYTQVANIVPSNITRPCIIINASNITYDGAGFWIANSTFNNTGIYAQGRLNVTVKNVNVSLNRSTSGNSFGIQFASTNRSLVADSIFNFNYYGVYLTAKSGNSTFRNVTASSNGFHGIATLATGDSASYGNQFNNIVANNNSQSGINIANPLGTFTNVTASFNGQNGIVLNSYLIKIVNATVNNNSVSGLYGAIASHGNITGFTANYNLAGVLLYSSTNVTVSNGNINNSRAYAVQLHDDTDDGGATNTDNKLSNINITNTNVSGYDLYVSFEALDPDTTLYAENNYLINTYVGNYSIAALSGNVVDHGIKLIVEDTRFGEIKFLNYVNGSGTNFSADVRLLNNSATVRSDVNNGLNKTANVTLRGVRTKNNYGILRDGSVCPAGVCRNFTSLNAGTVRFNVSYWTNYSLNHSIPRFPYLSVQTCNAEEDSDNPNQFFAGCDGSYPTSCSDDLVSCDDNETYYEDQSVNAGTYAGIEVSAYNSSVTNCGSITSVKVCYEWYILEGSPLLEGCDMYVDDTGGADYVSVGGVACPGVGPTPVTCFDVTGLKSWSCTHFFAGGGAKAQVKSELRNADASDIDLAHDLLTFNVSYTLANTAPSNGTAVSINSTLGLNRTREDLNVRTTLIDQNNNTMNVTVRWFNNTFPHVAVEYNSSYANGSTFIATLGHLNTTKGHNWSAQLSIFDGITTFRVNSTNLTILNTPPNATLLTPGDGANTINRTNQNFTWASSDDDGDTISAWEFYIEPILVSSCSDSVFQGTSAVLGLFNLATDGNGLLNCLIDNGDSYIWKVRVSDGTYGEYTNTFALNVQAYLNIIMNISAIQFGSLGYLQTNDTSDNSPNPIIMINEGNVLNDIKVHASSLWNSVTNPTSYFQFKFDNASTNGIFENNTFRNTGTNVTYISVPASAPSYSHLFDLKYVNTNDTIEADFNVTVPPTEGPGFKNTTITFTIALGSGDTY